MNDFSLSESFWKFSNPKISNIDIEYSLILSLLFLSLLLLSLLLLSLLLLYLGNIEFIKKENEINVDIVGNKKEDAENAAEFLGLTYIELKTILTQKDRPSLGTTEYYNNEKAENIRDSIAKEIYSKLFDYIIEKINEKIKGEGVEDKNNKDKNNEYSISILDIFGFENFQNDSDNEKSFKGLACENSLEQLCINYANERLQQYFN